MTNEPRPTRGNTANAVEPAKYALSSGFAFNVLIVVASSSFEGAPDGASSATAVREKSAVMAKARMFFMGADDVAPFPSGNGPMRDFDQTRSRACNCSNNGSMKRLNSASYAFETGAAL